MTATAPVVLAIDAMSGDHGLNMAVDAALLALAEYPVLQLILVGDPDLLSAALQTRKLPAETLLRLSVHPASEVISMDESPSKALRTKTDSSNLVESTLVCDGRDHRSEVRRVGKEWVR